MTTQSTTLAAAPARPLAVRFAVALVGALAVAVAAQFAVPIPGTAVPMTLQPLAVLIVGGLLGPRTGALSMVLYLAMGAAGLPVFTPVGLPGFARLFGPTGGYLLAYPVAAAFVGVLARRHAGTPARSAPRTLASCLLAALGGMAAIHAGGLAQLAILTGSVAPAIAAGVVPFLAGDLLKAGVAALVIGRFLPSMRALG
jgi:biotin transport system substrate-specific component